jgi:hypothetical protein
MATAGSGDVGIPSCPTFDLSLVLWSLCGSGTDQMRGLFEGMAKRLDGRFAILQWLG